MSARTFILFVFLLYANTVFAQEHPAHLGQLSVEQGLSQLSVLSIYQDSEGYLWFGTRNGLNKYDGYRFQVFRESSKDTLHISHNHIMCIAGDKDGYVWVGTNRGLNRYDAATGRFTKFLSREDSTTISNSTVSALLSDSDGDLWVGTADGLNLYDFENRRFKRCRLSDFLTDNRIYALTEGPGGDIWMGTNNGILVYNKKNGTTRIYRHNPADERSISENRINCIFRDKQNNIWIGTYQSGICRYAGTGDRFERFDRRHGVNDNSIRCFAEDTQGNLLVGTFNGINRYDRPTETFRSAYGAPGGKPAVGHFSVYSMLCDRAGTVWIGTYSGGLSYYSPYNQRFRFYDPGMRGQVIFGIIGPMAEHPGGLWIGTEGGGLMYFDRQAETFTYYSLPGANSFSYGRNIVKSLLPEGDMLWAGTTRQSVVAFDTRERCFKGTVVPTWSTLYYALYKDRKQRLWIGSTGGQALGYMTPEGKFVRPVPFGRGETFSPSNVRCMVEADDGSIFVGSWTNGLYRYNEQEKTVKNWLYTPGDTSGLPYNSVGTICKARDGKIWVGTYGGGLCLYRPQTGDFKIYDDRAGLADNTICTVAEDRNGKLWMSTGSGISGFDPVTEKFTNYERDNGIGIPEFTPGSGIVTADNEVFFGGNNGFVSFRPESMQTNNYIPPIFITDLTINNIPTPLPAQNKIALNHRQSNITIRFNALNYIFPEQNRYAYKLEGFDNEWNYVGNRHTAYYTNIPPGDYVFRVKGSNNDGVWNETGASMSIFIARPWQNTWWARALYAISVLLMVTVALRYSRIKTRLENNIRLKQMEQENMETLHQTKIKLFTNFSHELRTPLTLILTPLEDLLQQSGLAPALRDTLNLMYKNANRLLYTVNQLMDFRKKESGHLQLKAAQGNLVKFVGEIVLAFNELAGKRRIKFRFVCNDAELHVWYDRNLLEKVLFNLLSNAFKNTPDQGEIVVTLSRKTGKLLRRAYPERMKQVYPDCDEYVMIDVKDTGRGIPYGELEKIFDPFYQINQNEAAQIFGTGVGLNLSRGVVELHRGAIWAENNADKGAVFRAILPTGNAHLTSAEMIADYKNSENAVHYPISEDTAETSETEEPSDNRQEYTILVVEDNADVRHYIKSHLAKSYAVLEADNGNDALNIAVDRLPDLIISDIMMPGMDGIHLCRLLKEDIRTGHIPVILLTARVTVLQVQEGFEAGADEYITKPFNAGLLTTRVKNLIASRERLRLLFEQKSGEPNIELPSSSMDSRFMNSVYDFLNRNMSDPELDIDLFCREVGMSRTNLYRKIKSVTNLSPSELIRNTRLKYAAKYLKETDMPISEIAYDVGFSSPSYFTKTFRAFFGISPTEMRDKKTA